MTLILIPLWFFTLSLLSFALMYLDKRAAVQRTWRVPEATLLIWAFLGGALGAKLGQGRFRHKTRKQPFGALLNLALAVNVVVFTVLLISEDTRQAALHAVGWRAFRT